MRVGEMNNGRYERRCDEKAEDPITHCTTLVSAGRVVDCARSQLS